MGGRGGVPDALEGVGSEIDPAEGTVACGLEVLVEAALTDCRHTPSRKRCEKEGEQCSERLGACVRYKCVGTPGSCGRRVVCPCTAGTPGSRSTNGS
jgi:hypothetical protein